MAGVSLVGYSGSLIKDAVKELAFVPSALSSHAEGVPPVEGPEVTKVLVGACSIFSRDLLALWVQLSGCAC